MKDGAASSNAPAGYRLLLPLALRLLFPACVWFALPHVLASNRMVTLKVDTNGVPRLCGVSLGGKTIRHGVFQVLAHCQAYLVIEVPHLPSERTNLVSQLELEMGKAGITGGIHGPRYEQVASIQLFGGANG